MKQAIDFTKGKPLPLLIRFAIPIFIGYLFQQGYSLVDRIIVGQYIGTDAFSAIGSTSALSNLFLALCIGAASGTGIAVSQYCGAKDEEKTAAAIANGTYVCAAVVVIMTAAALLFTEPLLVLLNTPASLLPDAALYMKIYLGGMIAVAAYYTPFSILQGMGDSRTPLYFLVVCSVLNIVLDLLFVVVFGLGVAGAAIATVIAQLLAALLCIAYAFRKIPAFQNAFHMRSADKELILYVLKLSIPSGIQYALMYLSSVALQGIVNRFGEEAVGAFTATTQVEILIQQFYLGIANALMSYTGQNIGAKKPERIKNGVASASLLCLAASALFAVILWLFGENIIAVFVNDLGIIELGAAGIRITGSFLMAYGIATLLRYMLMGAGDTGFAVAAGTVEIIAKIAFGCLLTAIPFLGRMGIWWTTAFTWVAAAAFALWRYVRGKWRKAMNK